jgi:hypothetical protein
VQRACQSAWRSVGARTCQEVLPENVSAAGFWAWFPGFAPGGDSGARARATRRRFIESGEALPVPPKSLIRPDPRNSPWRPCQKRFCGWFLGLACGVRAGRIIRRQGTRNAPTMLRSPVGPTGAAEIADPREPEKPAPETSPRNASRVGKSPIGGVRVSVPECTYAGQQRRRPSGIMGVSERLWLRRDGAKRDRTVRAEAGDDSPHAIVGARPRTRTEILLATAGESRT